MGLISEFASSRVGSRLFLLQKPSLRILSCSIKASSPFRNMIEKVGLFSRAELLLLSSNSAETHRLRR